MDLPHRLTSPEDRSEALALIRAAFAYMDGRIDPPSSMHRLTAEDLAQGLLLGIGRPLVACVQLTPQPDALYLGKLAVAEAARGTGLARALVAAARVEARRLGLPKLRLQTRIELTENHATFAALGFAKVAETAHPGFDRPTSITMERGVENDL